MHKIRIDANKEDKNARLDKFLTSKLLTIRSDISRSRVQELINNNLVEYNTKPISSCSYKVNGNEIFDITIPNPIPTIISPKDIEFEVIFEDKNMLVVNKPSGLTTHPGNGNQENTLVNALLFHCGDNLSGINGIIRPGIVHRLDKDTSGLMVVAKNDLSHQNLSEQIQKRVLKRNYLAFCYGVVSPVSGVIDKNIDRSKTNRLKMAIYKNSGRKAVTNYKLIKTYHNGLFSLIKCSLDTGRTHQIRVHLSSIGNSIIGDQIYGGRRKSFKDVDLEVRNFIDNFPRQALHSYKISFFHPVSKKEMSFKIPLPQDMKKLEDILN